MPSFPLSTAGAYRPALSLALAISLTGCQTPPNATVSPANQPASEKEGESAATLQPVQAAAPPEENLLQPPDANGLRLPRGFSSQILASDLKTPRRILVMPGATAASYGLLVAESSANRITRLDVQNGKAAGRATFASNLSQPYGMAFGAGHFYVGNTDSVVRFPWKAGQTTVTGAPSKVTNLTRGGYNQHWTRNLLFDAGGKKLFVTVGSSCNTCEEDDSQRAAISVMNPDGSGRTLYGSGLRNPVGMALYPGTNTLWTVVNERDNLGDDVPPDYLTSVRQGAFYGWPYAYVDMKRKIHPDPGFGSRNQAMVSKTVAADFPLQAHSACLGVTFVPLNGHKLPASYSGDALLTFHGSWNRSERTGYKVVRVNFTNGTPGAISDFVTGFLSDENVSGRPVDITLAPDSSILFSDDGAGRIWRISYTP